MRPGEGRPRRAEAWAPGPFAALVAAVVGAGALPAAPGVPAQETPPPPLPAHEFRLPPFHERTLANGVRLVVVPRQGMPWVSVDLVVAGGRTADPPGRVGLADLTARLLLRGTSTRSAREVAETLDFLGAELDATAGSDWTTVSAGILAPHLPTVLDLVADVILRPTFPAAEVEALRLRKLEALEAELARPSGLADRAFLRAVYGDHPYGRLETAQTLRALDRAAAVDFHRTWYRPGGALLVVAGDVEVERVVALVEAAFGAWEGAPAPAIDPGLPPLRHAPRVVLVHEPRAETAALRVGHTVVTGDHPDWPALTMLAEVLGGGPAARLPRALRQARLTPVARVEAQRRLHRGLFRVSAESPTGSAARVLDELSAQLLRVREEPVSLAELRDVRDFLVGGWPLRLETPQQLAGHLTTGRLLGIPDSAMATWPDRIAALGVGRLREVAAARIQPGELVFVVVGDAVRLQGPLTGFGDVTVVDPRGDPVAGEDLVAGERSRTLDASALGPETAEYRVAFEGRPVGRAVRTLEAGAAPGTMVYRGTADMGSESISQSVTFTVPGFRAVAARARTESPAGAVSMDVRVRDGRLVGSVRGPGGVVERIDGAMPRGAVLGDMVELVPRVAGLEEGEELVVPMVEPTTGVARPVRYRVVGLEEVTVPAGTFQAYRVEIEGVEPQTVWVDRAPPHVPVRIRPRDVPVVLELTAPSGSGPLTDGRRRLHLWRRSPW